MNDLIKEKPENLENILPYGDLYRSRVEHHPDFFDIINFQTNPDLTVTKIEENIKKIFESIDNYTDLNSQTFRNISFAKQYIKQLFLPQLIAYIDSRLNKKIDIDNKKVTPENVLEKNLQTSAYNPGYENHEKNQIMNALFAKIKNKLINPDTNAAAKMFKEYYIDRQKEHFDPIFKDGKPVNFYYEDDVKFSSTPGFISEYKNINTGITHNIKYHSVRLSDILNIMGQKESSLMYIDIARQMGCHFDENAQQLADSENNISSYQEKLDQLVDHISNYIMVTRAFFSHPVVKNRDI